MQEGVKDQETGPLINSWRIPVKPLTRRVESLPWHYLPIKCANDGNTVFRALFHPSANHAAAGCLFWESVTHYYLATQHFEEQSRMLQCPLSPLKPLSDQKLHMLLEKAIQKAKESISKPISSLIIDSVND